MLKYILSIFVFFYFIHLSTCQSENKIDDTHSIGTEMSIAIFTHYFSMEDSDKELGTTYALKTIFDFNLKYIRKINKHYRINVLGNYYKMSSDFSLDYKAIENSKNIDYNLNTTLDYRQFSFLILPEAGFGETFRFFAQVGIGLGFTMVDNFIDGNLIVTGLDEDFKRIKQIPDIKGNHLSFKYSFGVGWSTLFDHTSMNFGYRFTGDLKRKLNLNGLNMNLKKNAIYLGVSYFLY